GAGEAAQGRLGGEPVRLEQPGAAARAERGRDRGTRLGLQQRLAAGETREAVRAELEALAGPEQRGERDRVRDGDALAGPARDLDAAALRRLPGAGRVAPGAAQVALAEAHEERGLPDVRALALHRGEDLDQ